MNKKRTIVLVIVLLLFAASLCIAKLWDNGEKIDIDDGKIAIVPQSPTQSDTPASPTPPPTQGEDIPYTPEKTEDPDALAKQERIRELIQSVYSLRNYYVSELNSMEKAARAEYFALPEEERTQANKESIATRYINSAYGLESECDGKIDAICAELGELLLETNGDFSLVNKVRYTYASEKAAMKDEIKQNYSEFFK